MDYQCVVAYESSLHKSSAVAEIGDRGHNRHGPKRGGLLCPFRGKMGAGTPSNTMWPGPTSTSVPIRLATIDMGQKLGERGCALFSGGS